jgi:hypothetical protein
MKSPNNKRKTYAFSAFTFGRRTAMRRKAA